MQASQVIETLNISRSTLYNCAFARNGLIVNSAEYHQRYRDERDQ